MSIADLNFVKIFFFDMKMGGEFFRCPNHHSILIHMPAP